MLKPRCTFVMVKGAFTRFDKDFLVFVPQNQRIACAFIEKFHEDAFSVFYHLQIIFNIYISWKMEL
jgi:hypothetical protein